MLHGKIDILARRARGAAQKTGGGAGRPRRRWTSASRPQILAGQGERRSPGIEMSHIYCPECGFQNPEAANYCSKCGALLYKESRARDDA